MNAIVKGRPAQPGRKEFKKIQMRDVLFFLKGEQKQHSEKEMGEYAHLTEFDLRQEVCFLLQLDYRPVGIACVRFSPSGRGRRLTHLYVSPGFRRRGLASHFISNIKITELAVPTSKITFISLCRRLGFAYSQRQSFPLTLAELTFVGTSPWKPKSPFAPSVGKTSKPSSVVRVGRSIMTLTKKSDT